MYGFGLKLLRLLIVHADLLLIFPLFKKKATFLTAFETLRKEKEKQKGTRQLIYQDIKNWMRPLKQQLLNLNLKPAGQVHL